MVSFSCEECGDVLTKKKLDAHRSRCHGATFTCIDCMVHFYGTHYRSHTACITEDQKYQGALYKEKTKHGKQPARPQPKTDDKGKMKAKPAFAEDVSEDVGFSVWDAYEGHAHDESPAGPPPRAPTPPSAANEDHVNVFDFLVATGQTPNASTVDLAQEKQRAGAQSTSLVRYAPNHQDNPDPSSRMEEDTPLVEYGWEPVPSSKYQTPANKSERRKHKDGEEKKDKKRKRLHVDVPSDRVMTDAPPILHSGLTGGLKSLMRPALPPSPDYSGGDGADPSPASPLKKTKHSSHPRHRTTSNNIFGIMLNGSGKTKKRKTSKRHSHHADKNRASNLIEYRPSSKDGRGAKEDGHGKMILYKPRADVFLSFVNKGPESERGCSMNKALKRFHRERKASGSSLGKVTEEKELWRSLRMKRNDRGEIVLFSEEFDLGQGAL